MAPFIETELSRNRKKSVTHRGLKEGEIVILYEDARAIVTVEIKNDDQAEVTVVTGLGVFAGHLTYDGIQVSPVNEIVPIKNTYLVEKQSIFVEKPPGPGIGITWPPVTDRRRVIWLPSLLAKPKEPV